VSGGVIALRQPPEALWPSWLDPAALHGVVGELTASFTTNAWSSMSYVVHGPGVSTNPPG
jgi:hypothetical protein